MTKQQPTDHPSDEKIATTLLALKAPVEFFERIDRWCQWVKERDGMTVTPSRPRAIRYIVDQFLVKEEAKMKRRAKRRRVT